MKPDDAKSSDVKPGSAISVHDGVKLFNGEGDRITGILTNQNSYIKYGRILMEIKEYDRVMGLGAKNVRLCGKPDSNGIVEVELVNDVAEVNEVQIDYSDFQEAQRLVEELIEVLPDKLRGFPLSLLSRMAAGDGGDIEDFAEFDQELVNFGFGWFAGKKT